MIRRRVRFSADMCLDLLSCSRVLVAAHFRQRGIPVVLGGPHVTLIPDEAQEHADVIFIGEAEFHWPQFLKEFETGQYSDRYCCLEPPTLD